MVNVGAQYEEARQPWLFVLSIGLYSRRLSGDACSVDVKVAT